MPTYSSRGLRLYYQDVGSGPAMVLIHGWGASSTEWISSGWTAKLTGRRLLIPDVCGHGQSARPVDPNAYAMGHLADDMVALLATAGVSDADVFGYSMGGAIALWTAISEPAKVRTLIVGAMSGSDPDQARSMGRQILGQEPITPRAEIYREYAIVNGATDLTSLAAALISGLECPPCVDLAIYGGETLVVSGDQDRRSDFTQDLAGCLPGGRFLSLPGVDHMGAFADPRFHSAASEFLASYSPL